MAPVCMPPLYIPDIHHQRKRPASAVTYGYGVGECLSPHKKQKTVSDSALTAAVATSTSSTTTETSDYDTTFPYAATWPANEVTTLPNLTQRFLDMLLGQCDGVADLNSLSSQISSCKRRIYDVTNVLEGIGVIRKTAKNVVQWCAPLAPKDFLGLLHLSQDLDILLEEEMMLEKKVSDAKLSLSEQQLRKPFGYVTCQDLVSLNIVNSDEHAIVASGLCKIPAANQDQVTSSDRGKQSAESIPRLDLAQKSNQPASMLLAQDDGTFVGLPNGPCQPPPAYMFPFPVPSPPMSTGSDVTVLDSSCSSTGTSTPDSRCSPVTELGDDLTCLLSSFLEEESTSSDSSPTECPQMTVNEFQELLAMVEGLSGHADLKMLLGDKPQQTPMMYNDITDLLF